MLRSRLVSVPGKQQKAALGNDTLHHHLNRTSDASLDELYSNARSGLRGVLIFLIASALAFYFKEQSLTGSLATSTMDLLGSTPPVILVNCVFGASTLSSLILIGGRIVNNREPGSTATHLCFRVFFYLLYFTSGVLGDYFNMVFISGLVVLGLQHYNVWNYFMRAIETTTANCNGMSR